MIEPLRVVFGDGAVFNEHYERIIGPTDVEVVFNGTPDTEYGSYLAVPKYARIFPTPKPIHVSALTTIVCIDCKHALVLAEFAKHTASKTGRNRRCRRCDAVHQRSWAARRLARERSC